MKPSVVLAVLTGIIALAILSGCATGSENQTLKERAQTLKERATEASNHVDGSESGWRKTYKYKTPEFRSQCTEDEFSETVMEITTLLMAGSDEKYKIEVLNVSESGNVGTVVYRIFGESFEEDGSDKWIMVDGTWWDDSWNKDGDNPLSLDCQD